MTASVTEAPSFTPRPDGTRIAYRHRPGRGPTLVYLTGYRGEMLGTKASAVDAWGQQTGRAVLRLDYAGYGESDGDFEAQSLEDRLGDVLLAMDAAGVGRAVLMGSSMGGWIMLLAALGTPERIAGLIGIAAAPDFTDWGFDEAKRETLRVHGRIDHPSDGGGTYPTSRVFWDSGQRNLLLDRGIPYNGPLRLIHGDADETVPWAISTRLMSALGSADVQLTLVKDGDHRLQRPGDIDALLRVTAGLLDDLGED